MHTRVSLTSCKECAENSIERFYTADSFENVFTWKCKLTKRENNLIAYDETFDHDHRIPDWCPKGFGKKTVVKKKNKSKKKAKGPLTRLQFISHGQSASKEPI